MQSLCTITMFCLFVDGNADASDDAPLESVRERMESAGKNVRNLNNFIHVRTQLKAVR